jgi:hypothetical protein
MANKKYYNEKLGSKIKYHIQTLNEDPFFIANFNTIYSFLDTQQGESLLTFMK